MPVKFWQRAAALAAWIVVWQLAAVSLGHGGLFLATPIQTLQALAQLAPTAGFWQRIVFSALRILAGFLLAVVGGLVLGALGARWRWVRIFIEPAMQLIRAMPVASFVILALLWVRSANLSVVVSFTHVLPVVYAGVQGGIADTDSQLLEMAHVYRLPLITRLRYIWLPGIFPSFCESCIAAMGMCWKSGVSAEVIGLPDHSVGDALYRAKITLSTPDVFAWTLVIVLLSAVHCPTETLQHGVGAEAFAEVFDNDAHACTSPQRRAFTARSRRAATVDSSAESSTMTSVQANTSGVDRVILAR